MLPSLSIIIPSFNQVSFIEETLCSIINQKYPGLELIVIDGGSTDGSTEIIRRYEKYISYWVSETDRGQSHAINKGLEKATGEWVGWINSDDCYLSGGLIHFFTESPHGSNDFMYGYCSTGSTIQTAVAKKPTPGSRDSLYQLLHFFFNSRHIIPSHAAFVRRTFLSKAGLFDENLEYCMDLDWFARIFQATNRIAHLPLAVGFYRLHPKAKTSRQHLQMQQEARQIALKYAVFLTKKESWLLKRKIRYKEKLGLLMEKQLPGLLNLMKLALLYPEAAAIDARIKIVIKQSLSRGKNKPVPA